MGSGHCDYPFFDAFAVSILLSALPHMPGPIPSSFLHPPMDFLLVLPHHIFPFLPSSSFRDHLNPPNLLLSRRASLSPLNSPPLRLILFPLSPASFHRISAVPFPDPMWVLIASLPPLRRPLSSGPPSVFFTLLFVLLPDADRAWRRWAGRGGAGGSGWPRRWLGAGRGAVSMDEAVVGLHQRDNHGCWDADPAEGLGNTLSVVEHDEEPPRGRLGRRHRARARGGTAVTSSIRPAEEMLARAESLTGAYLTGREAHHDER